MASRSLERRYERASRLLERLTHMAGLGVPIVVEGRRDVEALRRLGITGAILCYKTYPGSLHDFLESLRSARHVILLTDFDREGEELISRLARGLRSMRVKVDDSIWRKLKGVAGLEVRGIEDMLGYLERLRRQVEG